MIYYSINDYVFLNIYSMVYVGEVRMINSLLNIICLLQFNMK